MRAIACAIVFAAFLISDVIENKGEDREEDKGKDNIIRGVLWLTVGFVAFGL